MKLPHIGFVIVVPLVLCLYPLIALGDPHIWRKVYGQLAEGVGYKASFLLNLDMPYWFAIGWVVGWAIPWNIKNSRLSPAAGRDGGKEH